MEYYSKKADKKPIAVHHVLAALCQKLDIGSVREDNSEGETQMTDLTNFQSILGGNDTAQDFDSTEHPTDSASDAINRVYLTSNSCNVTVGKPFHGICIYNRSRKGLSLVLSKPRGNVARSMSHSALQNQMPGMFSALGRTNISCLVC